MKCKACGATHGSAEFYQSIKNYCKVHWRERVKSNRSQKIDYYRAHDRARGFRGPADLTRRYKLQHPERRAAQITLNNAIRDGRVTPWPACSHPEGCERKTVEAHHPDYSRPLDVVWLCPAHHKQAHAMSLQFHDHQ